MSKNIILLIGIIVLLIICSSVIGIYMSTTKKKSQTSISQESSSSSPPAPSPSSEQSDESSIPPDSREESSLPPKQSSSKQSSSKQSSSPTTRSQSQSSMPSNDSILPDDSTLPPADDSKLEPEGVMSITTANGAIFEKIENVRCSLFTDPPSGNTLEEILNNCANTKKLNNNKPCIGIEKLISGQYRGCLESNINSDMPNNSWILTNDMYNFNDEIKQLTDFINDKENKVLLDVNKKEGAFFYLYPIYKKENNALHKITCRNPDESDLRFYRMGQLLNKEDISDKSMFNTFNKQPSLFAFRYDESSKKYLLKRNFQQINQSFLANNSTTSPSYTYGNKFSFETDITTYINNIENIICPQIKNIINKINMGDRLKCKTYIPVNDSIYFGVEDITISTYKSITNLKNKINNMKDVVNSFIDHDDNTGMFIGINIYFNLKSLNNITSTTNSLIYSLTTKIDVNNIRKINSSSGVQNITNKIKESKELSITNLGTDIPYKYLKPVYDGKYTFFEENNIIYLKRTYTDPGYGALVRYCNITTQLDDLKTELKNNKSNYTVNMSVTENEILLTLSF